MIAAFICVTSVALAAPGGMQALVGDNVRGDPEGIAAALGRAGFTHVALDAAREDQALRAALARFEVSRFGEQARASRSFLVWNEQRVVGPRPVRVPLTAPGLVAVLAGSLTPNETIVPGSVVDLTAHVKDGVLAWEAPEGRWTLMTFGVVRIDVPAGNAGSWLGPAIERREARLAWADDFPQRYEQTYREPFDRKALAALVFDVGERTELERVRLSARADALDAPAGALLNLIDAREPTLPFEVPRVGGVALRTWTSAATGKHFGWNVRAAAGLAAVEARALCCVLPEEGNWALSPAYLRFHIDLAFLWGARDVVWPPFPADAIEFRKDGTAPALPCSWPHVADIVRYAAALPQAPAGGPPAAEICIALPGESVQGRGTTGLGPAVASQLQGECRDFVVTELGLLARAPGPVPFAGIAVPCDDVLSVRAAETLRAWAERGVAIVLVGARPTTSPEEGRGSALLAAALDALAKSQNFVLAATPEKAVEELRARVVPKLRVAAGLGGRIWSRTLGGGRHFLLNSSEERWHGEIALRGAASASWCDASELAKSPAWLRTPPVRVEGEEAFVELRLLPYQSIVLAAGVAPACGAEIARVPLAGGWTQLPLFSEGPALPPRLMVQTVQVFRSEAEARAPGSRGFLFDLGMGTPCELPRWRATWITSPEGELRNGEPGAARVSFHCTFHLEHPAVEARLWASSRGEASIDLNDAAAVSAGPGTVAYAEVAALLVPGKNTLKVDVPEPGHLLLELVVRTLDGKERFIATDPSWRASSRRQRWRPAFVVGAPEPSLPGPWGDVPATLVGRASLPPGTAAIGLPAGWRKIGYMGEDGTVLDPAFPLERPVRALWAFPKGSAEAPALTAAAVAVTPGPGNALGADDFAGVIRYATTFEVAAQDLARAGAAALSLGEVGSFARVTLNGSDVGAAWSPPYELWVRDALVPGVNSLRVDVSTSSAPRRRFAWPASSFTRAARAFLIEKNADASCPGLHGPAELRLYEAKAR